MLECYSTPRRCARFFHLATARICLYSAARTYPTMKITLFVPTLNEIDSVRVVMPRVKREWVDEILVVDGNSTDGTKEYFLENGYHVVTQKKPGVLAAWWEGFDRATGDVIIPFSPDNNSVPEAIPQLVAKINEGYDMVIASRYKGNAKSHDDNWLTAFGNALFTFLINLLFRSSYTDALGMYRAFKKSLITDLRLDQSRDLIFEILINIRCAKKRVKVAEIAADEPARIGNPESRAWPGLMGRIRGGLAILKVIVHEVLHP